MRVVASKAETIELGDAPVQVVLAPMTAGAGKTLAQYLAALAPGERLYLVLRDVRAAEQPGVLYHLYLNLPPGATPGKDDPRHVGTLNFYGAVPLGGGAGAAGAEGTARQSPQRSIFRSYDITDVVRTLRDRGMLSDGVSVTICHGGGAAASAARPAIGRIDLVVQ